jgi:hypothetical protein
MSLELAVVPAKMGYTAIFKSKLNNPTLPDDPFF